MQPAYDRLQSLVSRLVWPWL